MASLLLDHTFWDLCVDANGNLAVADDPYAMAQDVACACKTWLGECYFDTTLGVPYDKIIGGKPTLGYVKAALIKAALSVPGVVSARVAITSRRTRNITGQLFFTDANGIEQGISL